MESLFHFTRVEFTDRQFWFQSLQQISFNEQNLFLNKICYLSKNKIHIAVTYMFPFSMQSSKLAYFAAVVNYSCKLFVTLVPIITYFCISLVFYYVKINPC
jgi:hypothetical protein